MTCARTAILLFLAAFVGCTAQPALPDPDSAIVPLPEGTVIERLDSGLRVRGLLLQGRPSAPGPIEAVGTGPVARGWANCPTLRLTDPSRRTNRNALVQAGEVATRVLVSTQPVSPSETRVAVRAEHSGVYLNPFSNHAQRTSCPSTGVLERSLLEAAKL